ncbi:ankyrin repeat protein [Thelonectria olida]|uniref:Ankyrin repeat protein n=1 Tax=Thelonectria olida TaxID=1576542 RepID=A0A9P8WDX3_9HYPO|nr:ankyrin repeat protein [Thelonectria olida]
MPSNTFAMAEVAFGALEAAVCITEIVKLLHSYITGVKEAKDDIRKLTQELFGLKGALEHFDLHDTHIDKTIQPQVDGMLEMTQETLNDIQRRIGKPPSSGLGKVARSLSWPFKSGEIQKHVNTIERAKTWFIMIILKDTSETTLAIYDQVKALAEILHQDIIEKQATKMIQERDQLLEWLAPVNAQEMIKKAAQNKIPGTGRWIMDEAFSDWLELPDSKKPIVWITGKSGSGKTVLFSTIVDELQEICSTDSSSNSNLGYHCCSLDDAASQQISNIFGSIIAHAGNLKPEILQHISPYRRANTSLVPQNNLAIPQINEILGHILASCGIFYILIDAVNETPHEHELVQALVQLCEQYSQIRVLVTCTREPLVELPCIKELGMNVNAVDNDIDAYVVHRLATEPCFRILSPKIQAEIQQKIAAGADGMFRWAKLCMDRLSVLRTGRDVKDALQDMPTTLNDTYTSILGRILEHDREIAREALLWLCFSLRPLTLDELAEAVVLRESDTSIDDDCRLTNPIIIVDICRDLVVRSPPAVRLAHDSIRTFLTSSHIRQTSASFFALDSAAAHSRILCKSLCYLRLDVFASGPVTEVEDFYHRVKSYPLSSYATTYWPIHSERYPLTQNDEALILSFFATKALPNGSSFDSWVQLLLETHSPQAIKRSEPLYYAASFNMLSILKLLLRPELGVDLNRPGGRFGSTPLFTAVWRRNVEAAKLLLDAGADPFLGDGDGVAKHPMTTYELAQRFQLKEILKAIEELNA